MMELIAAHWITASILVVIAADLAGKIVVRMLRTINIIFRGWPPAHLDADGDWQPMPDQAEEIEVQIKGE
jgi:hypothetical protein